MAKAIIHESGPHSEVRVPPPVPDGTQYVESLGFIDRLVGADRDRRRAEIELADLIMSETEWAASGGDPKPVEITEPVEGGTMSGLAGGKAFGLRPSNSGHADARSEICRTGR